MESNYMNSCNCRQQAANRHIADYSMTPLQTNGCPVTSASSHSTCAGFYDKIDTLPLGMAYVPVQHYNQMFPLCRGLKEGTIFPELCLPFCGKRRKCSC